MPAPEVPAEHASVRMETRGSAGPAPTGLTDRVKGGQIWATKSLPEKPAGAARLLFRMAPLRLAGRPVPGDLWNPPSGPCTVL